MTSDKDGRITPEQVLAEAHLASRVEQAEDGPVIVLNDNGQAARLALATLREAGFLVLPVEPSEAEAEAALKALLDHRHPGLEGAPLTAPAVRAYREVKLCLTAARKAVADG